MKKQRSDCLRGVMLNRETTFTISEFCRAIRSDDRFVLELVDQGIIDPLGKPGDWRFHGEALLRARRARRLMHDLGVNLPGVALALDLLDELEELRRRAT